jgi:hypothetical protein
MKPVVLMLLGALGLALVAMFGCGPAGKQVALNVAACVAGQLPSAVSSIIPQVSAAIAGTATDWTGALTTIGTTAGVDAVLCALKAILGQRASGAPDPIARARAEAWLAAHGVK